MRCVRLNRDWPVTRFSECKPNPLGPLGFRCIMAAQLHRLSSRRFCHGQACQTYFRQHLNLRRSPRPIASPPARTHHPPTQCPVRSRCPNEPPRSFTVLEHSIDRAGRRRDRKFKPVDFGQIQAGGDSVTDDIAAGEIVGASRRRKAAAGHVVANAPNPYSQSSA